MKSRLPSIRASGTYVDLNVLLRFANLLVAVLLLVAYAHVEDNPYVDERTVGLALLLCVQTHVALRLESRRRDPFVILIAFGMVFYFAFRIVTLTFYPFSAVFDRYPFDASDSNFALVFILVANVCLYTGLLAVRFTRKHPPMMQVGARQPTHPVGVTILLLLTFLLAHFSGNYWTVDTMPRALTVLVVFLSPPIVVAMALSYLLLFRTALSRGFVLTIGSLVFLEIVAHTLWGSRSAIIAFFQMFIIVALAINGSVRFSRRFVVGGALLLPLLLAILVASFAISTFNRVAREAGNNSLDVGRALTTASESASQLLDGPNLDLLISPMTARAGFFDFSAEVIAHVDEYGAVLSLGAYGRSIIDNILTPGFDIFDQPKASNALRFMYLDIGEPSKQAASESYHSDQFGIYGEFFALFGYGSLPILFLVAYFLKRCYVGIEDANPFLLAMKRVIVLIAFARLLDSFGMDWVIGEILPYVVALFMYMVLFASRQVPDGSGSGVRKSSGLQVARLPMGTQEV